VLFGKNDVWTEGAFQGRDLERFIRSRIDGERVTKRKVLTNYATCWRAPVFCSVDSHSLYPANLDWAVDAIQLFWDRQIFDGALPPGAGVRFQTRNSGITQLTTET
jgi:hypothetical protein